MRPTTREARTQFLPTVIAFAVGAVVFTLAGGFVTAALPSVPPSSPLHARA
jgi:hypothetical protein